MNTPNDIEILIHYAVCPEQHPRFEAGAVQETIRRFLGEGIFVKIGERIKVTTKGRVWIKMILDTPYPEQVWMDYRNKEIIDLKEKNNADTDTR